MPYLPAQATSAITIEPPPPPPAGTTYPDDPDSWCENTLTPPEGAWSIFPLTESTLTLDDELRAVGLHSVRGWHTVRKGDDHISMIFTLIGSVDMDIYQGVHLYFAVTNINQMYDPKIILWDVNNNKVFQSIATPPVKNQLFEYLVGGGSQYAVLWRQLIGETFDWKQVKAIEIRVETKSPVIPYSGIMWIDQMYFVQLIGEYLLTVTVVEKDTTAPIPNATVTPWLLSGSRPDPENPDQLLPVYMELPMFTQLTSSEGKTVFNTLGPDIYAVEVKADGYKTKVQPDINLTQSSQSITVELEKFGLEDILKLIIPIAVAGGVMIVVGTLIAKA